MSGEYVALCKSLGAQRTGGTQVGQHRRILKNRMVVIRQHCLMKHFMKSNICQRRIWGCSSQGVVILLDVISQTMPGHIGLSAHITGEQNCRCSVRGGNRWAMRCGAHSCLSEDHTVMLLAKDLPTEFTRGFCIVDLVNRFQGMSMLCKGLSMLC